MEILCEGYTTAFLFVWCHGNLFIYLGRVGGVYQWGLFVCVGLSMKAGFWVKNSFAFSCIVLDFGTVTFYFQI